LDPSLVTLSATELAHLIRSRRVSPVEVVEAHLDAIERRNAAINAYVTVLGEEALEAAREAERHLSRGDAVGPLHGVPYALKDLFETRAGVRTTSGSLPFRDHVAERTATPVARLEAAGAIVLGKTNTPEFGYKGTTDNRLFGPTSTPFAPGKNAGGSSGGSAAAVAAGLTPLAEGSDGGGSIRIPAALCGVYGFKATFGRVASAARPDGFLLHTPFAHAGPLARTVEDAALMLQAMVGPDPRDPLSLPDLGEDLVAATRAPVAGMRVAYSPDFGGFPVEPRVRAVVERALAAFEEQGAHVERVELAWPRPHQELATMWTRTSAVRAAESAVSMAQAGIDLFGEQADELDPDYRHKLELGRELSAVAYRLDDVLRTEVFDRVQDVFERYDLLVTPTLSVAGIDNAADGTTRGPAEVEGQPVDPHIGWCLTYPLNFTGHPAASIPAGFTADGLPVGLQLVGRRFEDGRVLAGSAALERARPWHGAYARAAAAMEGAGR
jgi:Asp-tRNA(Asn)/Glu-tRNA(Gln) amidotransferase A subunit family amidase